MPRIVLCGLLLSIGAFAAQPIRIESGQVAGFPGRNKSITVYKGIPFAAPPVGDKRWHAAEPPLKWQGIRAADRFGANCIQTIVEEIDIVAFAQDARHVAWLDAGRQKIQCSLP